MTEAQEQVLQQNIKILDSKINMLFGMHGNLEQNSLKGDPTVPHQLVLERAIGGYVVTIGRDGSRVVCPNITKALLTLADYCEETVVVNGATNENIEEDD